LLDLSKTLTNKATDLTRYADTLPWNQTLADGYKRIAGEMSKWDIDAFAPDQAKQYTQLFDWLSGKALGELFSMGWQQTDELLNIFIKHADDELKLISEMKTFWLARNLTWTDDMVRRTSLFTDMRSLHTSTWLLRDIAKYGDDLLWFMKTLAKVL
jgi:hypothetical protein